MLEVEAYQTELLSIISQEHDMKLQEIQADYQAKYREHKLTIVDEYETRLKDNLSYYVGILLKSGTAPRENLFSDILVVWT